MSAGKPYCHRQQVEEYKPEWLKEGLMTDCAVILRYHRHVRKPVPRDVVQHGAP